MQTNFTPALLKVLKYEGGWSNDPRDPGGATFQGVTQRVYDDYRRRKNLGHQTVHLMTPGERDAIYKNGYWTPISGDTLASGVDLVTFDAAVNSGPGKALKWLKASIGGSNVDTIKRYCSKRLSFMHSLGTWSHFGGGWARRVSDVEATALKWASGTAAPVVLKKASEEAKEQSVSTAKKATVPATGAVAAPASTVAVPPVDTTPNHTTGIADYINIEYVAIGIGIILAIVAVYLLWKAYQHSVRADVLKEASIEKA